MTQNIRVIAVTGPGRSGTTLLSRIVAAGTNGLAVGELEGLVNLAADPTWRCSCSAMLTECDVWSTCLRDLKFTGAVARLRRLSRRLRWFQLPTLIVPGLRGWFLNGLEAELVDLRRLIVMAAEAEGTQTIVDSSKGPAYFSALAWLPQVDLWVLHLVRDARATAYSWKREKELWPGSKRMMPTYGVLRAAGDWLYRNLGIELAIRPFLNAGQYMRISYEDFVSDPRQVTDRIAEFLGDSFGEESLWVSDSEVIVGSDHVVGGNSNRFSTGAVKIVADNEWRGSFGGTSRLATTALTWPLLARYGYLRRAEEKPDRC